MEACVKEAFGSNTALFSSNILNIGILGLKVVVTIMAVSNLRLCILSNYNGAGVRKASYGIGFLQDGGAGKYNNSIGSAEWESKAIWDNTPDLAVLIVPLEERHKYFRVNIALSIELGLDDVSKILDLEALTAIFLYDYDFSSITLGYIGDSSLCTVCGHYCKAVKFKVYYVDQSISIYLQFNQSNYTRISGFPQSDYQFADYIGMTRCLLPSEIGLSKRRCRNFSTRIAL
ncbi:patatin domain-containing protein [Bipolaris maydis]|nr:patatin domain-containing protein [Bipolaris maydis]